jgi:protein SCO1/2
MRRWIPGIAAILLGVAVLRTESREAAAQTFFVRGVVLAIKPDTAQLIIRHEPIAGYMDGMTMPFKVRERAALAGLKRGDQMTFQLHVTADESWADHFQKIGVVPLPNNEAGPVKTLAPLPDKSLLDYKFTNELGEAVRFNDFRGQALAITFFYTRCPLPDYCPRLSMNFKEASQELEAMAHAPTNWHFISVSFDPQSDTPQILRSYGLSYGYDPAHWSFFTGPPDKIAELARVAGIQYEANAGTINHNFRTLIIDPQGRLQMAFPVSGNLSEQIVSEILKAAAKKESSPAKEAIR